MCELISTLVIDRDKRLVLISAVLFSAGFAPLPFGFLAYVCLVPMFLVAEGKSLGRGFTLGYLFGFEISVLTLYWVTSFVLNSSQSVTFIHPVISGALLGIFCFLGLAVLHSLFYAAIFGIFCWLYRQHRLFIVSLPFIWASVEYLRTMSQFAFPWVNLSYTQWYCLPLIQSADIWGDIGLSFFIAVVNLLVLAVVKLRRRIGWAIVPLIAVLSLFGAALYYDSRVEDFEPGDIRVALLQGHFPLKEKWDRERTMYNIEVYDSLTREAHAQ